MTTTLSKNPKNHTIVLQKGENEVYFYLDPIYLFYTVEDEDLDDYAQYELEECFEIYKCSCNRRIDEDDIHKVYQYLSNKGWTILKDHRY